MATNLSRYCQLGNHVEDDVDETRVQEYGSDESDRKHPVLDYCDPDSLT